MQKDEGYSKCIRCGKTRILLKRWKDHGVTGKGNVVHHEQTVCPDSECQKIVDEKFQAMRDIKAKAEERKKAVLESKLMAKKPVSTSAKA